MNCSIYLHLTLDIGGTNKIFHNREGTKTDLYLTHQLFCFRSWLFWDPLMSIYSTVVWISFSNIVSLLCTILFPIFEMNGSHCCCDFWWLNRNNFPTTLWHCPSLPPPSHWPLPTRSTAGGEMRGRVTCPTSGVQHTDFLFYICEEYISSCDRSMKLC